MDSVSCHKVPCSYLGNGKTRRRQRAGVDGVAKLSQSLQQTASGLQAAGQGARQLKDGVSQVRQYLSATKSAETAGNPGFHVPESAVTSNADLRKAMDAYISPDGHIAKYGHL